MLRTTGLSYSYHSSDQMRFPDMHCKAGEHWLLLGQSGSGKTTLLHLLGGLRSPQKGSIQIGEVDISTLPTYRLDKFRGQNIGIIFQEPHFVRSLTVRENLALARQMAGLKPDAPRIVSLLEQLNLKHKLNAPTSALSVGEKQRVAIARAIINNPEVILADEPTSALDDENTTQVVQLLKEQANRVNAVLLIVTHDNRLKEQFDKQILL
jgi:putative ABC transport system ATP-binding protein